MKMAAKSLVALLAMVALMVHAAYGLMMQVEPRTTECFHYKANHVGEDITFEFVVTRGGLLDVNFRIVSPSGSVLHQQLHFFPEGEEFVKTIRVNQAGDYAFCFDNEMSRWTAKVVKFELTSTTDAPQQQASTSETLKPLERSVRNIKRELDRVIKEQRYLRVREQTHRDTQESTYSRVYMFSTLESVVLIGMTVFQIYYMKKWFNTRKTGGV